MFTSPGLADRRAERANAFLLESQMARITFTPSYKFIPHEDVRAFGRHSIFFQRTRNPVLVVDSPDASLLSCNRCGSSIARYHKRAMNFIDLAFVCNGCLSMFEFEPRLPGFPVPNLCTVVPNDAWLLSSHSFPTRMCFASEKSFDGFLSEYSSNELPAWHLDDLFSNLKCFELMLNETSDGILATQLAKLARTPSGSRSGPRFASAFMHAKEILARLSPKHRVEIDESLLIAVSDLVTLNKLATRFSRHPSFRQMIRSLLESCNHTMFCLAILGHLFDRGHGVLGFPRQEDVCRLGLRADADLLLFADALDILVCELKTREAPFVIRQHSDMLRVRGEAMSWISGKIKDEKKKGQLRYGNAAFLAFGVFSNSSQVTQIIADVFRQLLVSKGQRRPNLAGLMIANRTPIADFERHIAGSNFEFDLVLNEHFTGSFQVGRGRFDYSHRGPQRVGLDKIELVRVY